MTNVTTSRVPLTQPSPQKERDIHIAQWCGLAWWMLVLLCSSAWWPRPFDDCKNFIFYGGGGVLALCALARRVASVRVTALSAMVLGYFLVGFLSLLQPATSFSEGVLSLSHIALWIFSAWWMAQQSLAWWQAVARWSVAVSAGLALGTLLDRLWWHGAVNRSAYFPPIGHISYFGDLMMLHAPLAVWNMQLARRGWRRVGWGIALAVLCAGVGLSGARASMLGLLASFFVIAGVATLRGTWRWRRVWWRLLLGSVAVLAVLQISSLANPRSENNSARFLRILSITSSQTLDDASSGRYHAWKTTWRMIRDHPVRGVGIGHFRFLYPAYAHQQQVDLLSSARVWFMHPHNEMLYQAVEMGLPGLLLWSGIWGWWLWHAVRVLRDRRTAPNVAWRVTIALAGIVAALVSWQFCTSGDFPLMRLLTALYVGLLWPVLLPSLPQRDAQYFFRWGLRVVLCIATLLTITQSLSLIVAQRANAAQTPEKRVAWARAAVWLAPTTFESAYTWAVAQLATDPSNAHAAILQLCAHFPEVPTVLWLAAYDAVHRGDRATARTLLTHALHNAPDFAEARGLLEQAQDRE